MNKKLTKLREDLAGNEVECVARYYVNVPSESSHSNHPDGGFGKNIDHRLKEYIYDLACQGIKK